MRFFCHFYKRASLYILWMCYLFLNIVYMKKTILSIAVIGVFLSLGLGQSFACSCMMPASPIESMKQADGVFVAKVKSVDAGNMRNTVQMDISENFKWVKPWAIKLTTGTNSAACGINFEAKKEYLVYAHKDKDGIYSANLCSRTKELKSAQEDIEALSENKESFHSKEIFELVKWATCKAASDGCNTLGFENGKIAFTTEMYCPDHTPTYSCTKEEEPVMCTMQYEPVCWVNWVTYGNSCMAGGAKIAYEWECSSLSQDERVLLDETSEKLNENTLTHINSALEKYKNIVSEKAVSEQSKVHKKVIAKADSYINKLASSSYMNAKTNMLLDAIIVLKLKVVEMLKSL